MWRYYLLSCAGIPSSDLQLWQWVLSRPGRSGVYPGVAVKSAYAAIWRASVGSCRGRSSTEQPVRKVAVVCGEVGVIGSDVARSRAPALAHANRYRLSPSLARFRCEDLRRLLDSGQAIEVDKPIGVFHVDRIEVSVP